MMLRIDNINVDQQEFCRFLNQWLRDTIELIAFDSKFMYDLIYDLSIEQIPERADSTLQLIYAKHVLCTPWGHYIGHYELWKKWAAVQFHMWKLTIAVPDVELHEVVSI